MSDATHANDENRRDVEMIVHGATLIEAGVDYFPDWHSQLKWEFDEVSVEQARRLFEVANSVVQRPQSERSASAAELLGVEIVAPEDTGIDPQPADMSNALAQVERSQPNGMSSRQLGRLVRKNWVAIVLASSVLVVFGYWLSRPDDSAEAAKRMIDRAAAKASEASLTLGILRTKMELTDGSEGRLQDTVDSAENYMSHLAMRHKMAGVTSQYAARRSSLQSQYDTLLTMEAWKQLSASEQRIVAKHFPDIAEIGQDEDLYLQLVGELF